MEKSKKRVLQQLKRKTNLDKDIAQHIISYIPKQKKAFHAWLTIVVAYLLQNNNNTPLTIHFVNDIQLVLEKERVYDDTITHTNIQVISDTANDAMYNTSFTLNRDFILHNDKGGNSHDYNVIRMLYHFFQHNIVLDGTFIRYVVMLKRHVDMYKTLAKLPLTWNKVVQPLTDERFRRVLDGIGLIRRTNNNQLMTLQEFFAKFPNELPEEVAIED